MENFDWTSFTKKIAIQANLSDLYDAWTIPEKLETWFLSHAEYEREHKGNIDRNSTIAANDTYKWSWFLYDPIETGRVVKANGSDHLQFTFAGDCLVDVKLTQFGKDVIVQLTQSNIPMDDSSKRGIRLGCDSGWSFFLLNLKSVFEGGLDLRNKNPELPGMLNA